MIILGVTLYFYWKDKHVFAMHHRGFVLNKVLTSCTFGKHPALDPPSVRFVGKVHLVSGSAFMLNQRLIYCHLSLGSVHRWSYVIDSLKDPTDHWDRVSSAGFFGGWLSFSSCSHVLFHFFLVRVRLRKVQIPKNKYTYKIDN